MASNLRITVVVSPNTINTGQMVQVSAIVTDKFGAPVVVPQLFMDIIDSTGRVYWPLSLMETNESGFSKLIATNELKHNTRYQVRVSINRKLIRKGWAFFKTTKQRGGAAFLTPLLIPLVLNPGNQLIPDGAKTLSFREAQIRISEINEKLDEQEPQNPFRKQLVKERQELQKIKPQPSKKKIFLTYQTEKDHRVCPICEPYQGLVFSINDKNIIRIGPSQLGGDTHYGCRCHYDMDVAVNPAKAKLDAMFRAFKAVLAVRAVKKHKQELVIRKP